MAASKKEKPIIEVKHLSKQYNIGVDGTYKTFCDSFTSAVRHPLKMLKESHKPNDTFWALNDVNFEIEQGEIVGIIGRNGAGKSTLLKILSRITYPTEGEIILRGRVGSLLEVGTGFHPELTGRENIYFNGAILGMKKREIDEKFEEIVKFSGVEKFLDTPVKRYSSGMQVRLAFSVAANLDPEILLVDEILAVGDAEFQKKCLGKMEDVAKKGKTVLFVSHNLDAITTLCNRVILLNGGRNVADGTPTEMVSLYMLKESPKKLDVDYNKKNIGDKFTKLLRVRIIKKDRTTSNTIVVNENFGIETTYQILEEGYKPSANFLISTQAGTKVFQSLETKTEGIFTKGKYRSIAWIPANLLNNETYILNIALTTHNPVYIHCQTEILFSVQDDLNAITRGDYKLQMHGVIRPYLFWETEKIDVEEL
ncbi:ABC transporter ATP-binding protein [Methanosarcina vacuolata]|uniref:Teichoic acid export ATP-binding protein TagH n=1 Tax=Methanosarcina vacuolata Z-761 TaxID=1434123 RepID=A0A0E3Q8C3_9EURY|nr:polysaccharide ABC transporter ATP-binding protein [Methanosarcina vacuolata]AKB45109.1 Teichoic acid export ATP-binding protein TagH [Methanosarcina vacuolata Z-761]